MGFGGGGGSKYYGHNKIPNLTLQIKDAFLDALFVCLT